MSSKIFFPPVRPVVDVVNCPEPQDAGIGGIIGERMDATRKNRLNRIIDHPLMLQGFVKKDLPYPWKPKADFSDSTWEGDISFAWQGEHVGKWLHAAVLLGLAAGDEDLVTRVKDVCNRLVSWQDPDGYLGTYDKASRMTASYGPHTAVSWDVWTHRYNLFGLLSSYRYLKKQGIAQQSWLDAAVKIGDLLIATFGPGKKNITFEGTRRGISSMTVLQSIMMLYQATGEERFLDFSRHLIYVSSEERTQVFSRMLNREPLTRVGYGKAYQLMSIFLGMLDLYRVTGDRELLQAVLNGWSQIVDDRVHITGGPWTKKTDRISNQECFADRSHWSPLEVVENCAAVTWFQLSLSLLRLTGEIRFAEQAEQTLYNHLFGAVTPDAVRGIYFSAPNQHERSYTARLHCCNSSGPRAVALMTTHVFGYREDGVSVNFYAPGSFSGELPKTKTKEECVKGGKIKLSLDTGYPYDGDIVIRWKSASPVQAPLFLRIPGWVTNPDVRVNRNRISRQGATSELEPGSWLKIEREWKSGDEIHLRLPVFTRTHHRTYLDREICAFTRGPIVLAAKGVRLAEDGLLKVPSGICPEALREPGTPTPRFLLPLLGRLPVNESEGQGERPAGEAVLMPYCLTAESAVVTWFECAHKV